MQLVGTVSVKVDGVGVVDVDILEHAIVIRDYEAALRNPGLRYRVRNTVQEALRNVESAFDEMILRSR